MTALHAIPVPSPSPAIATLPAAEEVYNAFTAAGIRVYVFQGKIEFGLSGNTDWDQAVSAWSMLSCLPGGHEALKRHLDR